MKLISPANQLVSIYLGKQKIKGDGLYRLSSFAIPVNIDNGVLLFHNMTKELVFLSSSLQDIDASVREYLIAHWFLVPDSCNERKISNDLSNLLRFHPFTDSGKSFTILPSTDCNARCFYCFEKDLCKATMDYDTAIQVVNFIKSQTNSKPFKLRWFGGEPLINHEIINYICSELNHSPGKTFVSSLITNGYLLNKEILNEAINEWNLESVQITLDGTAEIYNKAKNYIYDDANAFRVVMDNIKNIADSSVSLKIRLNIDLYNLTDMFSLIDQLGLEIRNKKNISISAVPLFEKAGAFPIDRDETKRETLYEGISRINKKIRATGFVSAERNLLGVRSNCCGADSNHAIVISPTGELLRCEHITGEQIVGTVFDGVSTISTGVWNEYLPDLEICGSCALYPTCYRLKGCLESEVCTDTIREHRINRLVKQLEQIYLNFKKQLDK